MIVLPLIIGAIAIAFVAVISLQSSTAARTTQSGDAQVVSEHFESDVHSAAEMTTDQSTGDMACGNAVTQTQVFGLQWQPVSLTSATPTYAMAVSYVVVKSGSTYSLLRQFCASGPSPNPTTTETVSFNVPQALAGPTVSVLPSTPSAATQWVSASNVTTVSWPITETGIGQASRVTLNYTVVAVPNASTSPSGIGTIAATGNTCNFATPGTGYYAGSLCFVDFSMFSNYMQVTSLAHPNDPNYCGQIKSSIPGTADTLEFDLCIAVTPTSGYPVTDPSQPWSSCPGPPYSYEPVCDATLPTYYDQANGSEAYLGNNGFYTGVAGQPALYSTVLGATVTLTFDNIALNGPTGPISGWELVTGDAESTDTGESITWTTSSNPTFSSTQHGTALKLLPDDPTAPYAIAQPQIADIGNACADPGFGTGYFPNTDLTPNTDLIDTGSYTVTCGSTKSSDKTGTVMLGVTPQLSTPQSMQVILNGNPGNGHEAVFVGVMLP